MCKLYKVLFILTAVSTINGCTTSTDYPYNANSVQYYVAAPVGKEPINMPVRPYYRYDHENRDYYHSSPIME